MTFLVARDGTEAVGCGAVLRDARGWGEVKRMYVRSQFRGLGFGKLMLNHLAEYALQQGVEVLRLETGIYQLEAIGLYERFGFQRIPPFGAYKEDPLSIFFEKRIV